MPQVEPKGRGRPVKHTPPPRIDATPEEIARAFFQSSSKVKTTKREYSCGDCGRKVSYPETLYEDGKCSDCHS
ncbi:MAG: hypothetical protein OXG88_06020 [Gammaproteobacteria bacterium]|nr:hypothetical protein [Gammaproteobacteria bacterium]